MNPIDPTNDEDGDGNGGASGGDSPCSGATTTSSLSMDTHIQSTNDPLTHKDMHLPLAAPPGLYMDNLSALPPPMPMPTGNPRPFLLGSFSDPPLAMSFESGRGQGLGQGQGRGLGQGLGQGQGQGQGQVNFGYAYNTGSDIGLDIIGNISDIGAERVLGARIEPCGPLLNALNSINSINSISTNLIGDLQLLQHGSDYHTSRISKEYHEYE